MLTQKPAIIAAYHRPAEQPAWYGHVSLHNDRVMDLSIQLGALYGLRGADLSMLAWAARWHDIGKLDLGPKVINKPGRLSNAEWALMRRHPRYGALRAWDLGAPRQVVDLIDAHHERWDGRGYGQGLARHQIPVGAQIISLADVFDAMTSERPYKRALSVGNAMDFMAADRERAFHPELFDLALGLFARLPRRVLTV